MIESVKRMAEIEQTLKDLGVPADRIDEATEYTDEYRKLKEGLDQARAKQFEDDAYTILWHVSAASNKAINHLSAKMREFAEHVAYHILKLYPESNTQTIKTIVDNLPTMSDLKETGEESAQ